MQRGPFLPPVKAGLLVLGLSLAFLAKAPGAVWLSSIQGIAVDEAGEPLPNTLLKFDDATNGRQFQCTTDARGKFVHVAVHPGRYRLEIARSKGRSQQFENLDIPWSAEPLLVDINLQRSFARVTRRVLLAESYGTEIENIPPPVASPSSQPSVFDQHLATAQKLNEQQRYGDAIAELRAALELDGNRADIWALLAQTYCESAKPGSAEHQDALEKCAANYRTALALAPQAAYFNNLGAAYVQLERYAQAAEQFRSAEQLGPEHAAMYEQNLGLALLKDAEQQKDSSTSLLRLQQAVAAFNKTLAVDPHRADALYWKGVCLLRLAGAEVSGATYDDAASAFSAYLSAFPSGKYAEQAGVMQQGLKAMAEPAR